MRFVIQRLYDTRVTNALEKVLYKSSLLMLANQKLRMMT